MNTGIRGLNLHIDDSINEICRVANSTSSHTRSALYILVLVNIISFVAFLNSNNLTGTWNSARFIENYVELQNRKLATVGHNPPVPDTTSINSELELLLRSKNLESSIRTMHENVDAVKVPAVGNTFDINDLGLVSGLTIAVLLSIMVFTLNRERTNLKIALSAVTDRYTPDSDADQFFGPTSTISTGSRNKTDILAAINQTRRQHHYNFLTMNELFNTPPVDIEEIKKASSLFVRAQQYLLWFPLIIYVLLVINDTATFSSMYELSPKLTIQLIIGEVLFTSVILYLSVRCTQVKRSIITLYTNFRDNNYKYA